jgi:hypothetical protein
VSAAIDGWKEALQHMKVGSEWELFVPTDLAYGQEEMGRIPPNSTLIFELELLGIGGAKSPSQGVLPPTQAPAPAASPKGR